jgi:hypothetical protein
MSLSTSFLYLYFASTECTTPVSSSIRCSSALHDAAPQAGHRVACRPVNRHHRPLLRPVTNGFPPPELPQAPPCTPLPPASVRPGRHLPELGTGAVLLSNPQGKLLDGLRRPAPPAYSRLSMPSWRLSPSESPTAPPPQIECPPRWHPPRPAPSTGLAAGHRNRPEPPPPERHG